MYEIARLASQRTACGLRRGEHRADRLVAGLRPAALSGPRAAEPAQRRGRAIDVRSVLSVPLDADRPVEQRESALLERSRILGGDEIAGRALFSAILLLGSARLNTPS